MESYVDFSQSYFDGVINKPIFIDYDTKILFILVNSEILVKINFLYSVLFFLEFCWWFWLPLLPWLLFFFNVIAHFLLFLFWFFSGFYLVFASPFGSLIHNYFFPILLCIYKENLKTKIVGYRVISSMQMGNI